MTEVEVMKFTRLVKRGNARRGVELSMVSGDLKRWPTFLT